MKRKWRKKAGSFSGLYENLDAFAFKNKFNRQLRK
jgi:hypothetical protein